MIYVVLFTLVSPTYEMLKSKGTENYVGAKIKLTRVCRRGRAIIVSYKYAAPPVSSTTMRVQHREDLTGAFVCRSGGLAQCPSEQRTGQCGADSKSPLLFRPAQ
jgi:hypothetical protein